MALRQHVRRNARLPRGERLHEQIALQLRYARPILHIAIEVGRVDAPVLRRQPRDGALQVANTGEVLVEA